MPRLLLTYLAVCFIVQPISIALAQPDCGILEDPPSRLGDLETASPILHITGSAERFAYVTRGPGGVGFEVGLGTVDAAGDPTVDGVYLGADGVPLGVSCAGDLVAVTITAEGSLPSGWTLIDFADPAHPDTTAFVALADDPRPRSLHLNGTVFGVGVATGGVQLFDIADTAAPLAAGRIPVGPTNAITSAGDTWYLTYRKLQVSEAVVGAFDCTDIQDPQYVTGHSNYFDLDLYTEYRELVVADGLLVTTRLKRYYNKFVDSTYYVEAYDVSDPAAMTQLATWQYSETPTGSVALAGGNLHLVIDNSIDYITTTAWQSAWTLGAVGVPQVTNAGGRLLVADQNSLAVWTAEGPQPSLLGLKNIGPTRAVSLAVDGSLAFVTRERNEWQDAAPLAQYVVFDLSDPAQPTVVTSRTFAGTGDFSQELSPAIAATAVKGPVIYKNVAQGLDYGDVAFAFDWETGGRGHALLSGSIRHAAVQGDALYAATGSQELVTVDVFHPLNPDSVGSYFSPTPFSYVENGYDSVYLVGANLTQLDIADPLAPRPGRSIWTGDPVLGATAVGTRIYVTSAGQLDIYQFGFSGAASWLGNVSLAGAFDVAVIGTFAYVADGESGVWIVDVADPTQPTLAGRYPTRTRPFGVETTANAVVVLTEHALLTFRPVCSRGDGGTPLAQVTATDLDFGVAGVSSELSVAVNNAGGGVLSLNATLSCNSATGFRLANPDNPVEISGGEVAEIGVIYDPAGLEAGAVSHCELLLGAGIAPINLQAQVRDPVAAWAVSDTLDYGIIEVTESGTLTAVITNTGDVALELDAALAEGCGSFRITTGTGQQTLAPAEEFRVSVVFAPTDTVIAECRLAWGPGLSSTLLRGTGGMPTFLQVSPASLDFATLDPGYTRYQTIQIDVVGETGRWVTPVLEPVGGPFSFGPADDTWLVLPGLTDHLNVRFSPTSSGSFQGELSLGPYLPVVLLSGTGTEFAPICIVPDTVVFAPDGLQSPVTQTLIIRNAGNLDMELAPTVNHPGFLVQGSGGAVVAPGDSLKLSVEYTAAFAGEVLGRLDLGPGVCAPVVLIGRPSSAIPLNQTALLPNVPNPFNPETRIRYVAATAGPVRIRIFDIAGRLVRNLHDAPSPAGLHEVVWNGQDDVGRSVASGAYYVRMEAGAVADLRKVMMIK